MLHNENSSLDDLSKLRAWLCLGWLIVMSLTLANFVPWRNAEILAWRTANALTDRQYDRARDLAFRGLAIAPESRYVRELVDEASWRSSHDLPMSMSTTPSDTPPGVDSPRMLLRNAESAMRSGLAFDAEEYLKAALAIDPSDVRVRHELAALLQSLGKVWESQPHVSYLIRRGLGRRDYLLMVGAPTFTFAVNDHLIERCRRTTPLDSRLALPEIRIALLKDRTEMAERLLRQIVEQYPGHAAAQARLGSILVEKPNTEEFIVWHEDLPQGIDHPLLWHVRGLWATRNDQESAGIRCFLQSLRLDPNHTAANYQLSQSLVRLGELGRSQAFAERATRLAKIEYLISDLKTRSDLTTMRRVAEHLAAIGRDWEAAGWSHTALWLDPNQAWARKILDQVRLTIVYSPTLVRLDKQPALEFDLNDFPLPNFRKPAVSASSRPSPGTILKKNRSPNEVRFEDVASEVGIDFTYFNGTTAQKGPQHILESMGGGIAVLDYDLDGNPDLYFAQSGPWGINESTSEYRDRLYRNLGDGRFEDVTTAAGLDNRRYSQGVAAGDFNSDGYPDLYVANVGANRLFENLGDGTFRDVAKEAGVDDESWSISAAIADLDNDSLPEIYCVNFLALDEVLGRKCTANGHAMGCTPSMFTAEQDRVFRNSGDGNFHDVTAEGGFQVPYGKGLGIVIADFAGHGRPDIFVGNDTTANFYFVNESNPQAGQAFSFHENGLLRGVAFGEGGHAQACMGIACGDVDRNGLLDLFVTNFAGDQNTLYLQREDHTFWDATRKAQLRRPSFDMLGFGTQFIDADLDGWLDLFVANGHVDRTDATGIPDRMSPQFFLNLGAGEFVECTGSAIGRYFEGKYFGRAVATLDWNGDCRQDFCVTHLDSPVALLTNRTLSAGRTLAIQLRGVESNRDAVGAIVRLETNGSVMVQQVVAGDGYMSSNQKQLLFGLGESDDIERLSVQWPSGRRQQFSNLSSARKLVIIEGERTPREISPLSSP